jgi:hypothetical protein
MKKLLIILLLALSLFFIPTPKAHATPGAETSIRNRFTWNLAYSSASQGILSSGYYLISNWVPVEFENLIFELNHDFMDLEDVYVPGYIGSTNVSGIYFAQEPYGNTIKRLYIIPEEPMEPTSYVYDYVTETYLDVEIPKNAYMQIKLQLRKGLSNFDLTSIVSIMNDHTQLGFDITINGYNDLINSPTIDDLPETTGSPFNEGFFGEVDWVYENNNFNAIIRYFGDYYITLENLSFPSTDFLDNVVQTYYYTEDGIPFIYFQYDEGEHMFTDTNINAKVWKGFALWNLDTNEVFLHQKVYVLTYLEFEENRDLFAYAYFPTTQIDDLLSASVTFQYRYGVKGITTLWQQQYTQWYVTELILEKDSEMLSAYPQWVKDVWMYSGVALAAGTVFSMIPGTQIIGIPLLLVGGIGLNAANVGAVNHLITGSVEEIVKLNYPSSVLRSKVNDHFTILTGSTVNITNQPLFRIYLGKYTKAESNYVEVNTDTYKYTELVFVTNGQVYVAPEELINQEVIMNQAYVESRPPETSHLDSFMDILLTLMIPIITFLFIILAWKVKVFSKPIWIPIIIGIYAFVLIFVTQYMQGM